MDEDQATPLRVAGWLSFAGGLIGLVGFAIHAVAFDDDTPATVKVLFAALYGGLGLLLLSVLRTRLQERKTDKYRNVKL